MSESQGDAQLSVQADEWSVSLLRLTVFPTSPLEVIGKHWWMGLLGEEPESRTEKPRTLELQEAGEYETHGLIVSTNPVVIDWRLVPAAVEGVPIDGIPVIGTFSDALSIFLPLMHRWLDEQCPELQRMALGAELVQPAEDHAAAYRRLASYVPVRLDPIGSSDFLYQINRPRPSRTDIPLLRINRLSKWSAMKLTLGGSLGDQLLELPGLEHFACLVELDINTAPGYPGTLNRDQFGTVLTELADLGKELAVNGDQP